MERRRKYFSLLTLKAGAVLALAFALLFPSMGALPDSKSEERHSEVLSPGIEHIEVRRGDFASTSVQDRWTIHALILDPRHTRLALARAMDEMVGLETTGSLAMRHGALAAVNGGYFRVAGTYRGESEGVIIASGKILSEPEKKRAALAVSQPGSRILAAISNLDLKAELKAGRNLTYPVSGFNRPREADELIVFTPEFHRTTLTAPDGFEAPVDHRGRVAGLLDGMGSQKIPPGGYILSAHGKARAWMLDNLKRGARVEIKTRIVAEPEIPFAADFIIGGGPRLLRAGKGVSDEEADRHSESLYRQRHPRTAAGWRADGTLVLAVVDGRQPRLSAGMTIRELADLMLDFGCIEAINLDGGGSTTMVIRNKVVNSPSDSGGERPVSDAILVFPR
jgi:hypothetical protein